MSKNQIALKEGRITQRDYDKMAVYKYNAYGNSEDLDVDKCYNEYGLGKFYPAFCVMSYNDRYIVSEQGFFDYIWDTLEVKPEFPKDNFEPTRGGNSSALYIQDYGWVWCPEGDGGEQLVHRCGRYGSLAEHYIGGYYE